MRFNSLIDKIISDFGIKVVKSSFDEIRCHCPLHSPDVNPSFSINKTTGKWFCQTERKGGDIIGLVMRLRKCSHEVAFKSLYGSDNLTHLKMRLDRISANKRGNKIDGSNTDDDCVGMPAGAVKLGSIEKCPTYLLSRIGFETIKKFKLGKMDESPSYYSGRILIPVYEDYLLKGFTTRDYTGKSAIKQLHPPNWNIGKYMFNVDAIDPAKEVIIVEGPFDAMYLTEKGFPNVVCIFGINLNVNRIKKLSERNVKKIILCFDNDEKTQSGQKAMEATTKTIKYYFRTSYVELPVGKDPDDLSKNELDYVFSNPVFVK